MSDPAEAPHHPPDIIDDEDKRDGPHKLVTQGGHQYRIKAYPMPAWDDLVSLRKLARNFDWRLIKAAQHGFEFPQFGERDPEKENKNITKIRKQLSILDKQLKPEIDPASAQTKLAQAKTEATTGLLAMALYKRMISGILKYFDERIGDERTPGKSNAELTDLLHKIDLDREEATYLFSLSPRRQGGSRDKQTDEVTKKKDDVIGEMIGEPFNLLTIIRMHDTNKADGGQHDTEIKMRQFFNNRYRKIASAMANMDAAENAVKKLINIPETPATDASGAEAQAQAPLSPVALLITEFMNAAKERVQMMRSDEKYYETICTLKGCGNAINDLTTDEIMKERTSVVKVRDPDSEKTLALLKRFTALVYDLAHVRTSRNRSTDEYNNKVNALLTEQKAPAVTQRVSM